MAPLRLVAHWPLLIGLLMGVLIINAARGGFSERFEPGIRFSAKKILRLAIILYGFRITFTQVASVGIVGITLDLFMVASTLFLGTVLGVRYFGMDKATAILTASGAAICGAAAVVATEPVVKSERHQTAVAVATVVFFGTLAMVLYPLLYRTGIIPLNEQDFGIYIGASLHGVAHAVAASDAVGPEAARVAIIVKMTRVLMLAPALLVIGWWIHRQSKASGTGAPITIPWFALGFLGVAAFNSLDLLPQPWVQRLAIGYLSTDHGDDWTWTGNPAEPVQGHWCLGVSVGVLPLYLVGRRRIHGHVGSFQHPLDLSLQRRSPRVLPSFPTRSNRCFATHCFWPCLNSVSDQLRGCNRNRFKEVEWKNEVSNSKEWHPRWRTAGGLKRQHSSGNRGSDNPHAPVRFGQLVWTGTGSARRL